MTLTILRFVDLLLSSLLVGTMFGIWLGFDPASLSPAAYVEQQQQAIRGLNVTMPVAGAICIALTLTLAFLAKGNPRERMLLLAAAACLIAAGGITRFLNQPINAVVMTWRPNAPPANWTALRDAWWRWHVVRTAVGVAALSALLWALLLNRPD